MNLEEAYRQVYRDMLLNGPSMFTGHFDAANGGEQAHYFMYGVETVMEYIANKTGIENENDKFSDMFELVMSDCISKCVTK